MENKESAHISKSGAHQQKTPPRNDKAVFSTINTILVFSIVALAIFQPNRYRFVAAAIFASITISHEIFLIDTTGILYYGTAALFALGIMIILAELKHMTETAYTLQKICFVTILANFGGFVLWFFYYPPIFYNIAFVGIYTWAVITLIRREKRNVGDSRTDVLLRSVRGNHSSRLSST